MASAWELGGLTWKELGRRVWQQVQEDDILGRAAQLSYYFLLALFPLLLFLISLLGYFAGTSVELRNSLFRYLGTVVPSSAFDLISTTIEQISEHSGGGKLSFGILATLWAASNGVGAIIEALNVAYDVKESRPWWKVRLRALSLTLALAVLIITALALVLSGEHIADGLAGSFGLSTAFTLTWKILQWPIVLAFLLLAFALIYYLAPDLKDQSWQWVTPGSVIALVLWLLISFGFRIYLNFFDSYSATYGSLGAVIVLLLWLYLTGAAILIGGEFNAEIEHAAAKSGEPDAKAPGQKHPQEGDRTDALSKGPGGVTAAAPTASGSKGKRAAQARVVEPLPRKTAEAARATPRRRFSLGKLAVVLGAGLFARLRGKGRRSS